MSHDSCSPPPPYRNNARVRLPSVAVFKRGAVEGQTISVCIFMTVPPVVAMVQWVTWPRQWQTSWEEHTHLPTSARLAKLGLFISIDLNFIHIFIIIINNYCLCLLVGLMCTLNACKNIRTSIIIISIIIIITDPIVPPLFPYMQANSPPPPSMCACMQLMNCFTEIILRYQFIHTKIFKRWAKKGGMQGLTKNCVKKSQINWVPIITDKDMHN